MHTKLPVRQDDAVGIRVQDIDNGVRFDEGLDFSKDKGPLQLILWLIGGGVLIDVFGQLSNQVSDKLHLFQQQADNDEASIVSQLFHHEVWSEDKK